MWDVLVKNGKNLESLESSECPVESQSPVHSPVQTPSPVQSLAYSPV